MLLLVFVGFVARLENIRDPTLETLDPCKDIFDIQAHLEKHKRTFDVMCISSKVTHLDTVDTTYDSPIHC